MSITTYAELQTAVAYWLRPGSGSTTDLRIDDFISLFESRANRVLRLVVMESDEAVTTVLNSRYVALPAGYIEPIGLWLTDENPREQLSYRLPTQLTVSTTSGRPEKWAVDGTNIAFEFPADDAYAGVFRMLKKFALSNSSPTNWLLTNHPDLYLYGSLLEAAPFVREISLVPMWRDFVAAALDEIQTKEARTKGAAWLLTDLPARNSRGSNILWG